MTPASQLLEVTRFAELGGFVLLDVAAVLATWVDGDGTTACDLLPRLSDETAVAQLAGRGGLLPIVVEEPDDVTIRVHLDPLPPPALDLLIGDERGWTFSAGERGQHLLPIGYLTRWRADSDDAAPLHLPAGAYTVRVRWGLRNADPCVDLLLEPGRPSAPRDLPIAVFFG